MSEVHHELRRLFADAMIRAAGGFDTTNHGRMVVANVDDLSLAVTEVVADLERRLGEADDERRVKEFRTELDEWSGAEPC
jgi:hypothetical protein